MKNLYTNATKSHIHKISGVVLQPNGSKNIVFLAVQPFTQDCHLFVLKRGLGVSQHWMAELPAIWLFRK
jgi:hypothetical protein